MPKLPRCRALALPIALMVLTAARTPEACSCGFDAPWPILLSATEDVPTNAEIVVAMPVDGRPRIVLREAFGGPEVEATASWQTMDLPDLHSTSDVIVLRPDGLLEPNTQYEVVAIRPGGEHPQQIVAGSITTGDEPDEEAPRLRPPRGVDVHAVRGRCSYRAWLEVAMAPAEDDGEVAYLAWVAKADATFPAAPQWRFPGREGRTQRVSRPYCGSEHYPDEPGSYRIRITAVDQAGHQSRAYTLPFRIP